MGSALPQPGFGAHSVGREPCGLETISQADTFLKLTAGFLEPSTLGSLSTSSLQGSDMESSNKISFPKQSSFPPAAPW